MSQTTIWNFKEWKAWQKGMDLAEMVYQESRTWPREELYGLTSQVRSSAVSVPSNIAEGLGRGWNRDLLRFLRIARGSLQELETQFILAERLHFTTPESTTRVQTLSLECARLISGMARKLLSDLPDKTSHVREDDGTYNFHDQDESLDDDWPLE